MMALLFCLLQEEVWVKTGRPNFEEIFVHMQKLHGEQQKCLVMVCGPQPLMKSVRKCCLEYSLPGGMQFDLHEETFEF